MRALIVLAKAPLPGYSKTRLARSAELASKTAAELADAFLRDTVAACEVVREAELVIGFTPRSSESFFRKLAPRARLVAQVEGDLGERIDAAFDSSFARGAVSTVVIGADTPHIAPATISRAFRELEHADAVFGPALDGGFYLVGLNATRPQLFRDVEWSTSRVLEQVLDRARDQRMRVALVDELFDIDEGLDLERLERWLDAHPERCSHTRRALVKVAQQRRARRERTQSRN